LIFGLYNLNLFLM